MYVLRVTDLKTGEEEKLEFNDERLAHIYKDYHLAFGDWKTRTKWVRADDLKPEQVRFVVTESEQQENGIPIRYYQITDQFLIDTPAPRLENARTVAEAFQVLRTKRSKMLLETDWTQLADVVMPQDLRKQYRAYREYLRDIPTLHNAETVDEAKIYSFEEWQNGKR